jgi:hydroxypyruvate isomerase
MDELGYDGSFGREYCPRVDSLLKGTGWQKKWRKENDAI